jgi:hypothetical protein
MSRNDYPFQQPADPHWLRLIVDPEVLENPGSHAPEQTLRQHNTKADPEKGQGQTMIDLSTREADEIQDNHQGDRRPDQQVFCAGERFNCCAALRSVVRLKFRVRLDCSQTSFTFPSRTITSDKTLIPSSEVAQENFVPTFSTFAPDR